MQETALEIRFDGGSHLVKWRHPDGTDPIRHFAGNIAPQFIPESLAVIPAAAGFVVESYYAEEGEARLSYVSTNAIEGVTVASEETIAYFGFMWQEGVEHQRAHRQAVMDGHPRIAVQLDEDSDLLYREGIAYQPVPTRDAVMQLRGELIIAIDSREADKVEAVMTKLGLGL